jgi:hypothetical protein
MGRIERGVNKVDLGRKGASKKAGRSWGDEGDKGSMIVLWDKLTRQRENVSKS